VVKIYVANGLGIGCHAEVAHAYEKAGGNVEIVHFRQLLNGEKDLFESQVLNLSGGFLHADLMSAGMCGANEIEHASFKYKGQMRRFKELLIEYAQKGNVIYGQCNGFQLLVKTGLLPGINGDYSRQTVTLTTNDCGNYWEAPVMHDIERKHFAFEDVDSPLYIMCRHGEGKLLFYSDFGLISKADGEKNRAIVNKKHVLLKYVDPTNINPTQKFPHNPNGSMDAIAGLIDETGNIIGHMAHPEVGIYCSRDSGFFLWKDKLKRSGIKAEDLDAEILEDTCLKIFRNIVNHFR